MCFGEVVNHSDYFVLKLWRTDTDTVYTFKVPQSVLSVPIWRTGNIYENLSAILKHCLPFTDWESSRMDHFIVYKGKLFYFETD